MKSIIQVENEENRFLTEFTHQYSEEIDVALNIARIYLNKNKQVDIIIDNLMIIEDKITIELWIVGHTSEQHYNTSKDITDLIKNIGFIIQTDNTINRLDSKAIITFNINKIKEHNQDILLLKILLRLYGLYTAMTIFIPY